MPAIGGGEFLVGNLWLSCDPAQRAWMEIDTYIPMLPLGEVMLPGSAWVGRRGLRRLVRRPDRREPGAPAADPGRGVGRRT